MLRNRSRESLLLALVACGVFALPAACSSSSSSGTGNDAGGFGDSSTPPDAGKKHDSGKTPDAGKTHDAGIDSHVTPPTDGGLDHSVPIVPDSSTTDSSTPDTGATCTVGTARCSGNGVETCTAGTWSAPTACPFVCTTGSCTGMCVPMATQCSATFYPQTCDSTGTWQGASTCTKDTDCCGTSFCNSANNQCAQTLPSESACTGDDQCASGECIVGDSGDSICQ